MKSALARSWFARHVVLTTWGLLGIAIALFAFSRGSDLIGALSTGTALGGFLVLLPFLYDPFPFPLTREQWPMKLPILRGLARRRHWANIFYVELITLRSAWRPSYCAEQLSDAMLKFPRFPVRGDHNFAGWQHGGRFVLKRLTLWANGMRPTASGLFTDEGPGTRVVVSVAAPAIGAYVLLMFLAAFIALSLILFVVALQAVRSPWQLALLVFGGTLFTLVITALFASPVPLPFATSRSEADRVIEFLDEVIGADVISRE